MTRGLPTGMLEEEEGSSLARAISKALKLGLDGGHRQSAEVAMVPVEMT